MSTQVFSAQVMNAFLEGTINVLKTMCQTDPIPGKPSLKKEKALTGDVSGSIALTSVDTHGVVIISFSKEAILLIVSRMLAEDYKDVNSEVKDAVGELTNMIAGSSRQGLVKIGLVFEAGIPTIVIGKNHEVYTKVSDKAPVISIPFETDMGSVFTVEFSFETAKAR